MTYLIKLLDIYNFTKLYSLLSASTIAKVRWIHKNWFGGKWGGDIPLICLGWTRVNFRKGTRFGFPLTTEASRPQQRGRKELKFSSINAKIGVGYFSLNSIGELHNSRSPHSSGERFQGRWSLRKFSLQFQWLIPKKWLKLDNTRRLLYMVVFSYWPQRQ